MSLPAPSPRQGRIIWLALTGLAIALLVALLIALVWGLGQIIRVLSPVLWPLAVAGVLAYLLDPLVDSLERRNIPRTRAILCVFALAAVQCSSTSVFSFVRLQSPERNERSAIVGSPGITGSAAGSRKKSGETRTMAESRMVLIDMGFSSERIGGRPFSRNF